MMTYKETTEYLFSQLPVFQHVGGSAYKPGLDTSLALDKLFNHPHKAYKTIHVGGTNGKGSTSHTIAAILQEAGYKVGLYTSPHLVDFRERIRVDGVMIDESYVIDFVEKYKTDFEPLNCSFFELTMMMSFCYFRDQKVDVAVIEVGLGGRLDSTNIILPDLSIITNIGLDHTQFLGTTLVKIASEKAGIIKENTPVVIGEANDEVKEVFLEKAFECDAPIAFADFEQPIIDSAQKDGKWSYTTNNYPVIVGELGGNVQLNNANTILIAISKLKQLDYDISEDAVLSGFANVTSLTGLMGRWQILQDNPKVVCDTGHNKDGIKYIVEQLRTEKYAQLHIIIGVANDKDISEILALMPQEATYYFVNAQINRALPAKELKKKADEYQLKGDAYSTIWQAFEDALLTSKSNDLIFIGGSNFVVGEFLELYNKKGAK